MPGWAGLSGPAVLTGGERERLAEIEADLRRDCPALDRALRHGAFRGLPDQRRRSYSRQAWPVAALATVGGVLVVLGLALPSTLALVAGFYLVPCSFLGLWIPLRRGAQPDRPCPCGRNPGMVPGHHHRPPRRFPGRPGSGSL